MTLANYMLLILVNGSILKKFLDDTANMSADDRAKHLKSNKVSKSMKISVMIWVIVLKKPTA